MALEFVGLLFKHLHGGVKQAMRKSATFKTLLGDLNSTLDSLESRDIQQIEVHIVELGLPNEEIRSLNILMQEGVKLVSKFSKFRPWNYCCLNDYSDQIAKLDRALKRLLQKLKMQEARDVKEVLALARQNRDKLDEVNRRLLDLHKLLQQNGGGDIDMENLASGSDDTETVPDQIQGNGVDQVKKLDQWTALAATFAELWDAVIKVKDKTIMFRPLLENLKSVLDSLRPIIEEILKYHKLLDRPKEEIENFRMKMEGGVELVHKCCKVGRWTSCKSYRYSEKILELKDSLQNLLSFLKVLVARDARETCVSIRNIEAVVKRIEESDVLQTQTQDLCALLEPLLPRVGEDILNLRGTRDVRETLVLVRDTKTGVEQIEGSSGIQNANEIKASPLGVPHGPRFAMSHRSVHLNLSQIAKATKNFSRSHILGDGGFGTTYKAQLDDGQVVVKRAKKEHFENLQTEFSSEVECLAKINHRSLVKLVGYVDEGNERLIISEYVPNGTLREHLDGLRGKTLELNQRLEIVVDVATTLNYLHLYLVKKIIHGNVKLSNVLLTECMKAKVADYGFARLGPMDLDQKLISTSVERTAGYLDPEYLKTYQLTPKSDVYSFGILLIEIMTGRRPVELTRSLEERVTLRWAVKKLNEGNVVELVDPAMKKVDADLLVKFFDLAKHCTSPISADRPHMHEVQGHLIDIWQTSLRKLRYGRLLLSQIAKATKNFSPPHILGEGGFGTTYKAQLDDGQVVVMKRAKKEHFKFENLQTEFSSEVKYLAKINHRSLVKLLGYVDEGNERLIIREYVPNGTLREHLDGLRGEILKLNQRLEIAYNVAEALSHLLHFHPYREKIIHVNLKSSNVLLTESMKAKVADYGFAMYSDQKHISTSVERTASYLDPEYLKTYQLTPKSVVYSFGILLIEIMTARRPVELKRRLEEQVTLRWALKELNEGNVVELVDPAMKEAVDAELLVKIFDLAKHCTSPVSADRPDMREVEMQLIDIRQTSLRKLKYGRLLLSQIAKATNNFSRSHILGEGGFGPTYYARLDDGQVVVKRAKKEHFENLKTEFSSEVEYLAEINHWSLVKLLGYVDEGSERLIITEYVPNGTLREHLDGLRGKILKLSQRLEIAYNVAEALSHLHRYGVHVNVKSSNVVLTESMKAKVADYGFARLSPMDSDQEHISTGVEGTAGYLDPEYLKTYQLTQKSVVYSCGILLIEIMTGRRPVELTRRLEEQVTLRWALEKLNEGNVAELVDPAMKEVVEAEVLVKVFDLAKHCTSPISADRPDMYDVLIQLVAIRISLL